MYLFYHSLGEWLMGMRHDKVETSKMIGCLYNVVYTYSLVRNAYGISLEDVPSLLMGQPASLDMI